MINGLISFSNIVETLSQPELCFAFNLLMIFFTVSCSINSKLKEYIDFPLSNMIPYFCLGVVESSLANQGLCLQRKY